MSKEAALAFLKKASEDAELQEKIVSFAREQGYEFTVQELTDQDLDAVAGGLTLSSGFIKYASPTLVEGKIESSLKLSTPGLLNPEGG